MQVTVTCLSQHLNALLKHTTDSSLSRNVKRLRATATVLSAVRHLLNRTCLRAVHSSVVLDPLVSDGLNIVRHPAAVDTHGVSLLFNLRLDVLLELSDTGGQEHHGLSVSRSRVLNVSVGRQRHNTVVANLRTSSLSNLLQEPQSSRAVITDADLSLLALTDDNDVAVAHQASGLRLHHCHCKGEVARDRHHILSIRVDVCLERRHAICHQQQALEQTKVTVVHTELTIHRVFSAVHSCSHQLSVQSDSLLRDVLPVEASHSLVAKTKVCVERKLVPDKVQKDEVLVSSLTLQCDTGLVVASQVLVRKHAVRVVLNVLLLLSRTQAVYLSNTGNRVKALRSLNKREHLLLAVRCGHCIVQPVHRSLRVEVVLPNKEQFVHVEVRTHLGHKLVGHNHTVHAFWQEVHNLDEATGVQAL